MISVSHTIHGRPTLIVFQSLGDYQKACHMKLDPYMTSHAYHSNYHGKQILNVTLNQQVFYCTYSSTRKKNPSQLFKPYQRAACFSRATQKHETHHTKNEKNECLGRFLGIIGQDPGVSKSNWLHVGTFQ